MAQTEVERTQTSAELFEVRNLNKWFRAREKGLLASFFSQKHLKAVDDISFDIHYNEFLGLAGQSGCGKSTLGELLLRLQKPTDGEIRFKGRDIGEFGKSEVKDFRKSCQVIFQDPYESLNPRFPVARIVSEPLRIHGIGNAEDRDAKMIQTLEEVGLRPPEKFLNMLPAELSGGERQRVAMARALVLDPEFLIADEPVSMLDVSVRTEILNTFRRLKREREFTMVYISHDISTIGYLTDRVMIMYLGDIVEIGPTNQVIYDPAHPYTQSLIEAVPRPDSEIEIEGSELEGEVPDPVDIPSGCRFHPNCKYETERCREEEPSLERLGSQGQTVPREAACWHPVTE